jgi:hypothetical protein
MAMISSIYEIPAGRFVIYKNASLPNFPRQTVSVFSVCPGAVPGSFRSLPVTVFAACSLSGREKTACPTASVHSPSLDYAIPIAQDAGWFALAIASERYGHFASHPEKACFCHCGISRRKGIAFEGNLLD